MTKDWQAIVEFMEHTTSLDRKYAEAELNKKLKAAVRRPRRAPEVGELLHAKPDPAGTRRERARYVALAIAKKHGLKIDELLGSGWRKRYMEARAQLYLELRLMGYSYPGIGKLVGRDHSTIHELLNVERKSARRKKRTPEAKGA